MHRNDEAKINGGESSSFGTDSNAHVGNHVAKVATGHVDVPACNAKLVWRCSRKRGHLKGCRPSVLVKGGDVPEPAVWNFTSHVAADLQTEAFERGRLRGADEEREACAQLADDIAGILGPATVIAYRIRQRGRVAP